MPQYPSREAGLELTGIIAGQPAAGCGVEVDFSVEFRTLAASKSDAV